MAFLDIDERDRLDLTLLHAAISDLNQTIVWAEHVMTKKWYRRPWSRGATYSHQSAYITAIVMAYGRVFSRGRNGRRFPDRLVKFDPDERALDTRLKEMRDAIYAHSSLDRWTVKPWRVDDFETTVINQPVNLIEQADLERLVGMAAKLRAAAGQRYSEIMARYRTEDDAVGAGRSTIDLAMEAIDNLEVGESPAIRVPEEPG